MNVSDCDVRPSAMTFVCWPIISEVFMVPVRVKVEKTSAGTVTIDAPLSTPKSSVIAPLISTQRISRRPFLMPLALP